MPTDSFFGKYRLIEPLGFGGMAEVFRAVLTGAEGFYRELAIKRIRPEYTGEKNFEKMFIDEARIAAKLHHANIVQIFDFDRIGSFAFIAMEYVRGQDLASILNRAKKTSQPIPIEVACHIVLEFLSGLRYAHEKTEGTVSLDIVHRDISPGNVLISYEGEVKLTDFGIAKAAIKATQTRTGELKGKYSYMSPEQIKHNQIDQRSDLFSAGVVFYEMLTLESPFKDETEYKTLNRIIHGEMRPLRELRPEVPEELESFVKRTMDISLQDRFQSAAQMLQDLEQVCRSNNLLPSPEALRKYLGCLFPVEVNREPEIFFGKYRLVERLREGKRTEVFRGVYTGAEDFLQELAIKRVRREYLGDSELEDRFIKDARASANLRHANIIQVFDVDRVGNSPYITMEYIRGHSLAAVCEQAGALGEPLPVSVALHIVLEVLAGLRYAHEKRREGTDAGFVHGDISPTNILVSFEGEVKITEFGIVDVFTRTVSPCELRSQYPHRSPEHLALRDIDPRSDLYSIAAVLYQVLTGETVDREASAEQIRGRIMNHDWLKQELEPELLNGLGDIVSRALAPDPADRPQTAADLRWELVDYCRKASLDPSPAQVRSLLERISLGEPEPQAQQLPPLSEGSEPVSKPVSTTGVTRADLPSKPSRPPPGKPISSSAPTFAEPIVKGDVKPVRRVSTPRPAPQKPDTIDAAFARVPPEARHRQPPRWKVMALVLAGLVAALLITFVVIPRLISERQGGDQAAAVPPDAPVFTILMRMLPPQQAWYRKQVFEPFERAHGVRIQMMHFNTIDEIPRILQEAKQPIDLVKVHLAVSRILLEQDLIIPVESVLKEAGRSSELDKMIPAFEPLALDLARIRTVIGHPLCYLPRKLETNFIAYRPSKVKDAQANWRDIVEDLGEELEKLTGHGLPAGYQMEDDLDKWDLYDTLVLHYYWARTSQDDGRAAPRVARRTYPSWGTYLELMDDLAGAGTEGRLVLDTSEEVIDIFEWLALYRELDLFHPQVVSGELDLTGSVIYDLMRRNEVYWTKLHSLAALELLGSRESGFPTIMTDPSDLDFVRFPLRVSLQLDSRGKYVRTGTRRSVTTGWFWGIPKTARDPLLSYQLAARMTDREVHSRDVEIFSIQPIRSDVRFESGGMGKRLAAVVERQMQDNRGRIVPRTKSISQLRRMMDQAFRAWEEIVVKRAYLDGQMVSREKIREALERVLSSKSPNLHPGE